MRRLNNISPSFERTLKTRMTEGSYEQFTHLWTLYGKIVSYSFSIIESVQRAINKEPMLLETKGGIPYLENACCNNALTITLIRVCVNTSFGSEEDIGVVRVKLTTPRIHISCG